MSDVREQVRDAYARAATTGSSCCGDSCCGDSGCGDESAFGPTLYAGEDLGTIPDEAKLASLGCGNPLMVAELREGEAVLDLGSGAGLDVLLSARRVGPTGVVYGLDMTDEMLAAAEANKLRAGATNVHFVKGYIEEIPLPAATVDVAISNCVINLSADKPSVFRELARVVRPGGRIGITDVVAGDELTIEERHERGPYVGCIAGALSFSEYRTGLEQAGFADVEVEPTHEVVDGMYSAIVRATRPQP